MIWIFNLQKASASLCDNYHDVFQYITELEKKKVSLNHNDHPLFPNISNLNSLNDKKKWCIDFCRRNKYTLIETPSQPLESRTSRWQTALAFESSKENIEHVS